MFARLFYFVTLLCSPLYTLQAAEFEDINALQQQVRDFAGDYLSSQGARYANLAANALDPRLKLKTCDKPLTHEIHSNSSSGGHLTVFTRCNGQHSQWSFYTPVKADLLLTLVIASHNLQRGDILTEDDIVLADYETDSMSNLYLTRTETALGKVLKRPARQGEPLRATMLEEPIAVRRGEKVVVSASAGGLTVVSSAEALANGRIGDVIKAKNLTTQRTIEGRITDIGKIEVNL